MPDFPSIQFVSAPSESADLRYDFNDRDATGRRAHPLGAGGLDLGVPSFSGEPEGVGFDYGYRRMHLTQRIEGSRNLALAKMSLLARELLRSTNWLRVQWEPGSAPRYFKTFRGEPGALDLENSGLDIWDVSVPLVAEGFAYGPRETHADIEFEQTIPTDLTAGRNPMTVALPAIKGDVPTALRVSVKPAAGVLATFPGDWLVGCLAGTSTMVDPAFNIGTGDGLTADIGTGAGVANAAYIGGDYRQISVSANDGGAGTSIARRLFGSLTASLRGRYKILVRCEADTASGVKSFAFRYFLGTDFTSPTTVWTAGVTGGGAVSSQGWVDLGDFTFPLTLNIPVDGAGTLPTAVDFYLYAGTTDNTAGTLRVDAIKFLPVGGPTVTGATLGKSTFRKVALSAARQAWWDGDSETSWILENTGVLMAQSNGEVAGAFPVADPTAGRNLLVVMAARSNGIAAHSTSYVTSRKSVTAVGVSYHPRYLYLGDGT